MKSEIQEVLTLAEPVIAWLGRHLEHLAPAQAYGRGQGDIATLTGIAERRCHDEGDTTDKDTDGELDPGDSRTV